MTQTLTNYATEAYAVTQTQALSPTQAMLQLYDFAVAGCVARDSRKSSAALVELIGALDFQYEDIAAGLYRLYEYALREVKAQRFDNALKILTGLREAWHQALAREPAEGN